MTLNAVEDTLHARLKSRWDEDAIVELTGLVAFQNLSSKLNAALYVPAQWFCRLLDPAERRLRRRRVRQQREDGRKKAVAIAVRNASGRRRSSNFDDWLRLGAWRAPLPTSVATDRAGIGNTPGRHETRTRSRRAERIGGEEVFDRGELPDALLRQSRASVAELIFVRVIACRRLFRSKSCKMAANFHRPKTVAALRR